MYEDELKHLSEKMDKSIQALRNEFTSIRTGQASPSLLDRVFVDYYGSKTPVNRWHLLPYRKQECLSCSLGIKEF